MELPDFTKTKSIHKATPPFPIYSWGVPCKGHITSPLMGRISSWAWGMLHNLLGVLCVQH